MEASLRIGQTVYPVRFGMAALLEYERKTGQSAITDFQQMQGGEVRISVMVDLVMAGLICGAKTNGLKLDIHEYDVADALGDQQTSEAMMKAFADSFPQPDSNEVDEKKTKAKK